MNEYQELLIRIARSPKESEKLFKIIAELRLRAWLWFLVAFGVGFTIGYLVR